MIASAWSDEFELPDGSYSISDVQDYIEYITKKHETSITTLNQKCPNTELFIVPIFLYLDWKTPYFGYFLHGAILPIHGFINNNNNRLMFKIKDGYKVEIRMPERMKLFESTEKLIGKTKMEKTYQVLK